MLKYLLFVIVCLLAIGGYLFYIYRAKGKAAMLGQIRYGLFQAMLAAEKKFGPNAGGDKLAFVLANLYDFAAPELVKKFISDDDLKAFVQKEYDRFYALAKDKLDDGKVNGSTNTVSLEAPKKEINPTGQVTNTEKL